MTEHIISNIFQTYFKHISNIFQTHLIVDLNGFCVRHINLKSQIDMRNLLKKNIIR